MSSLRLSPSCSACSYISKGSARGHQVLMIEMLFLMFSSQCIASFQPFCCQCFLIQLNCLFLNDWVLWRAPLPLLSEEVPSLNSNTFEKQHFPSETPPWWWSGRACFPTVASCVGNGGRTARFPFRCSAWEQSLCTWELSSSFCGVGQDEVLLRG